MGSKKVWLVGSSENDIFADIYASQESAEKAVLRTLFEDEDDHWIGRLHQTQQETLSSLRHAGVKFEAILNYYNTVCRKDDQWHIREAEVRP